MAKWLKRILGLLLLPFCVGAGMAAWEVLGQMGRVEEVWVPMAGGAACWWVVYLMLPPPMRLYVFGHELTHVLWTWLFGGKVKQFRVSARGGHVVVTRTNFLIVLSPYFFPLYVVLVVLAFAAGHWIWGWAEYQVWFLLLVGGAYSFHVTLTWEALQAEQSDIISQGYLFSASIIFLGNAGVLLFGLPLVVKDLSVQNSFALWFTASERVLFWLRDWVWRVGG